MKAKITGPRTSREHMTCCCVYLFWSGCSCLFAHPVPSLGTIITLGSFPLFSDFKLGRWAGGGMRRAVTTLPRLCKPCRGTTGQQTRGGHGNEEREMNNIQQIQNIWRRQRWISTKPAHLCFSEFLLIFPCTCQIGWVRNTCFSHPWPCLFAPNDRTLRCNVIEYGNFLLRPFSIPSDSREKWKSKHWHQT